MVKGVHLYRTEAVLFGVAVPAFPNGGRALLDGVAPGRIGFVLDQTIRQIAPPDLSESRQEDIHAQKADRQVSIFRLNPFDEMNCGLLALLIREQVIINRHTRDRSSRGRSGRHPPIPDFRNHGTLALYFQRCRLRSAYPSDQHSIW